MRQASTHLAIALLFRKSCLALMPYRENENHVLRRHPAVLGDVAKPPTRKYEFAAPVFGLTPEERMIGQEFKSAANAENLFSGALGVLCSQEFE